VALGDCRGGADKRGRKLNDFAPVRRVRNLEKGRASTQAVSNVRVRLSLIAHDRRFRFKGP
jgi:hypothetical protein